MCRVLGYLGEPIALEHVLFETDSSLVRQSYSPRMMADVPQPRRLRDGRLGPALRRTRTTRSPTASTTLPTFDRNLRSLSAQARPDLPDRPRPRRDPHAREMVAETNLHPFRFPDARVALAHNGHLREFARMRYDLLAAHPPRARPA